MFYIVIIFAFNTARKVSLSIYLFSNVLRIPYEYLDLKSINYAETAFYFFCKNIPLTHFTLCSILIQYMK